MSDERQGLPSASSMERVYRCPGSIALCKSAPAQPESEIAASGTRVHAAKETGERDDLADHSEEIVVDNLDALEADGVERWMASLDSHAAKPPALREQRLWIKARSKETDFMDASVASAKLDAFWISVEKKAALAYDYKSGFRDVTDSALNVQTRIQALAVLEEFPFLERIRVGILQGRKRSIDEADYDRPTLELAKRELLFHLHLSNQPDAPRVPGKHCKYCPAKSICVEAIVYALVAAQLSADGLVTAKAQAYVWRRKGITEDVFEAVQIALKGLSAEDLAELGLALKENPATMELPDAQTVFATLFKEGLLDAKAFHACCKALKGRIEKVVVPTLREKFGLKAGEAKQRLEGILEPISTMKPKQPSLVEKI